MFSVTAYEAYYRILGLDLSSSIRSVLVSEPFFKGAVMLTFGLSLFLLVIRYFSRYLPGFMGRSSASASSIFKLVICLVLGISLLKVDVPVSVKSYEGKSWHDSPYLLKRVPNAQAEYRVSLPFYLLTSAAEGLSAYLTKVVDWTFKGENHSQTKAPHFLFKGIMYGALATIDDRVLQEQVRFYTNECLVKLIPEISSVQGKLDEAFRNSVEIDQVLSTFPVASEETDPKTCLDVKNEMLASLKEFSTKKTGKLPVDFSRRIPITDEQTERMIISSALVNHFLDEREGYMSIQEGSQVPSGATQFFQGLGRTVSWNGLLSIIGQRQLHGAADAAKEAQKFSELLARAPHIKGFILAGLIVAFNFLIFPIVWGKWTVLLIWSLLYGSVLLWEPVWTAMYHIITNVLTQTSLLEQIGKLSDGISLYAAQIILSRIQYAISVYSWVQLAVPALLTLPVLFWLRGLFSKTEPEAAPEAVNNSRAAIGVARDTTAAGSMVSKIGGAV